MSEEVLRVWLVALSVDKQDHFQLWKRVPSVFVCLVVSDDGGDAILKARDLLHSEESEWRWTGGVHAMSERVLFNGLAEVYTEPHILEIGRMENTAPLPSEYLVGPVS